MKILQDHSKNDINSGAKDMPVLAGSNPNIFSELLRGFYKKAASKAKTTALALSITLAISTTASSIYAQTPQVKPQSLIAQTASSDHTNLRKTSTNWAGIIAISNAAKPEPAVTSVSGAWYVPKVQYGCTGDSSGAFDAQDTYVMYTWVGIGGYVNKDNTLIQIGTKERVDDGVVRYVAWYELFPYMQNIPISIKPGDLIYANVSLVKGTTDMWNLKFQDLTSGKPIYTKEVYYNASRLSADWVVERATGVWGVDYLPKFSKVNFVNINETIGNYATVGKTSGRISAFDTYSIDMYAGEGKRSVHKIATASKINKEGMFDVKYDVCNPFVSQI